MTAVAYIRRSASEESPVSEELQRETVARLAADNGHTIDQPIYRDWGRSGGAEDRPQYLAMLERIERGDVKAVYAYDQDRLARSNWLFAGLLRLADLHGFAVITPAGDLTDDSRRDFAEMRGVMDGAELRKMKRRAKAIDAKQRKRKDDRGVPPFGYEMKPREKRSPERVEFVKVDPDAIEHVIEAYRAAGTFLGAVRALNTEGFKAKRGGDWNPVTLRDLILREAPELVQGVTQGRRRRKPQPRYFRGLLRCHCGGSMSPGSTGKSTRGHLYYYCGRGNRGAHPGPHVIAESKLMPRIVEEAARYRYERFWDVDAEQRAVDTTDKRRRLKAARDLMSEDAYAEALALVDAEEQLSERVPAEAPPLDWEWSVEAINKWLRAAFDHVELGDDLLPVRAEWLVPEWRQG